MSQYSKEDLQKIFWTNFY